MVKNSKKKKKKKKIWKNLKKSQEITLKKLKEEEMLPKKNKTNTVPLVLPIEEISLRPEFSSPPRFIIHGGGGYPEGDGGGARKSLCLIFDRNTNTQRSIQGNY